MTFFESVPGCYMSISELETCIKSCFMGHLVGIGGVSMSPLAEVLYKMGVPITGSDMNDSDSVRRLKSLGINVKVGHQAENIKGANFIMETIVENKDAKIELFKQVEGCVGKDVIIASNTSGLDVFSLVPESILPQMMIAHWYAPAQHIPLVEVVKGAQTPDEYAKITVDLLEKCGKTAVLMKKFIRGYIANRMQMCLNVEVFNLLDNGYCTPEDIDKAVKASFIPRAVVLGICKRIDFGGLDMTANNYKNKSYTSPPPIDMPSSLAEHIEKGELGIKSGKGFYDYTGVDKQALIAKRDKQLFEIFKVTKKLMDDPV
jgi:3-hydroxyacyl-CoA dehydrogenase